MPHMADPPRGDSYRPDLVAHHTRGFFGDDGVARAGRLLVASDHGQPGQPVYERLGHLRIERWTGWLRP